MRLAFLPRLASLLACLQPALGAPAVQTTPAPAPAAASAPAAGAAPAPAPTDAMGQSVESLYRARSFERAKALCDELRAKAGAPMADLDSEYWAAKAVQALGDDEAARARLRAIAKAHAGQPRAADAAIDAALVGVNVPRGHVSDPQARATARAAATELETLAAELVALPASVARARFSAGNAWRIAEDDARARSAYEQARDMTEGEYPLRARHMLSVLAQRALDAGGARAMLSDCASNGPDSLKERCRKDLDRWTLVGSPAPPLSVETWISGEPQALDRLQGRVVLLWFFATWCPHCKEAMPEIAALQARTAGKPLTIIGLTVNEQGQTTESAKVFVSDRKWGIRYPVAVDRGSKTTDDFHAGAVPTAILIDKKGVVRWSQHPGYLSDALVDRLLAE